MLITLLKKTIIVTLITGFSLQYSRGELPRLAQPSDCVTTRYLANGEDDPVHKAITTNPQGTYLAYLLKVPNLKTNQNDMQLFTKDIQRDSGDGAVLLASDPSLSRIHWLSDGRHIVVLKSNAGSTAVVSIDVTTKAASVLVAGKRDIREYSISADGKSIAYSVDDEASPSAKVAQDNFDRSHGYRISFEAQPALAALPKRNIYYTTEIDGHWTPPERVKIVEPFSKASRDAFPSLQSSPVLSLSPDGRKLLIEYWSESPKEWANSPYTIANGRHGSKLVEYLVMQSMVDGTTSLPIASPYEWNAPLWSADSKSFVVIAQSPIGSSWEERDNDAGPIETGYHLFWKSVESGAIEEVSKTVGNVSEQPIYWDNDDLCFRVAADVVVHTRRQDRTWTITSSVHIPFSVISQFTGHGGLFYGDSQNITTPPEIIRFDAATGSVKPIERLNPQFDVVARPLIRKITWITSTGYDATGILLLPPNYSPDHRYPLIIQTKPYQGGFVCDTGRSHYPSFAPYPMADAGMLYLMRSIPDGYSYQDELNHYPQGYPGERVASSIAEAAFQADLYDSAVANLDRAGLADPQKVGIIGFSRSGWYTEFALTHGKTQYKAATVTDNVEYSVGQYWLNHSSSLLKDSDHMYGGPPYGKTLATWLDYSISFNLNKVHAPLLMEAMGNGNLYDNLQAPPLDVANRFEVFTGLNQLNKPVEFYYYPNEGHQPDHPQARLESLQRNLDWYRFWLQGIERSSPEDEGQYIRWRSLRELQQKDGSAFR